MQHTKWVTQVKLMCLLHCFLLLYTGSGIFKGTFVKAIARKLVLNYSLWRKMHLNTHPSVSVTLIYWTNKELRMFITSSFSWKIEICLPRQCFKTWLLKTHLPTSGSHCMNLGNCNPRFQDENFRSRTCERPLHLELTSGQHKENLQNF